MNVVLCGCSGTGKSSAIEKILTHFDEPIYGFWTRKLAPLDNGECSVYFHPCQEPITFTHRIGICKDRHAEKFPQVFDTVGVRSLTDIPEGSIVMMDEIGFMDFERTMAVCVKHRGPYDRLNDAYAAAVAWLDRNGMKLSDSPRESYIHGCWDRDSEEDYLTEVIFPIEP